MVHKLDFLIVGAQKSATTTLYDWLAQHPDIFLPTTKEILYFGMDEFYQQGVNYLDPFYESYAGEDLVGGAYVQLMYFPYAAERIYRHNNSMKIIALLRNPVKRAYSAYWYARSHGWEDCHSFEEALNLEHERAHGSFKEQASLTYLRHGHYAEQLHPYFQYFGRDKIKVLFTEQVKNQAEAEVQSVLNFLGVSEDTSFFDAGEYSNRSATPVFPKLQKALKNRDSWYKRAGRRFLPPKMRIYLRENLILWISEKNLRPYTYPPMRNDTKAHLEAYFRPHNEKLSELLDTPLPW